MKRIESPLGQNISTLWNGTLSKKQVSTFLLRYLYFFAGLFIAGVGNYLTIVAKNLGVSPWDVFHLGVSNHFPSIGFGTITAVVGFLVLILSLILGIRPYIGTFINMYFYGIVLNFLTSSNLLKVSQSWLLSFIYLVLGTIIIGFGSSLYLLSNAGVGPRDALMLGLHKKTHYSIAAVRTWIEVSAILVGFLLGGPFGIGTLIYSLTIGLCVQGSMYILHKLSSQPHESSQG